MTQCIETVSPATIQIMGTDRVSDFAMGAAAHIYSDMLSRLHPDFEAQTFDGLEVRITNGESHDELKQIDGVKDMWSDGYGTGSRNFLRGGARPSDIWISEQMICSRGVETRQADYAAGRSTINDENYRSFDQLIHEFAHALHFRLNLDADIKRVYAGKAMPNEAFAQDVQNWFYAHTPPHFHPGGEALMQSIFQSRTTYSCEGYPQADTP